MEEDITIDLCILQSHLEGMIDRVQHNSVTLRLLQDFEMRLLGLNSLSEVIDFILGESKTLFQLDVISLCLVDPKREVAGYLELENYDHKSKDALHLIEDELFLHNRFGLPFRPFLGIYRAEHCDGLFSKVAEKPASVIIVPLIRRGKCIGSLNMGSYQVKRFTSTMATDFIQHMASVVGICLENSINFETMRRTSLVDPLTGVNNRRFLEQRIEEELVHSQRSREPLSCLFLDIDYFKSINDGHGHQAGDHVLAQVAATIKKQLRSNDVLSRYGGEEFVALLTQSGEKIAEEIAERIRLRIAALQIEFQETLIPVTISIGVATMQPHELSGHSVRDSAIRLIQTADAALYEAKNKGRNRVEKSESVL